jgi:hypothetical protein
LPQHHAISVYDNPIDSASSVHSRDRFLRLVDEPVACSAWLSALGGSIWELDSGVMSEQMADVAACITDFPSARAFARACGSGVGLLKPLIEHGHQMHQAAFEAVMTALRNSILHINIRRNRLEVLSLFPDWHWPCVVTCILSMVALHPPCAVQAHAIIKCMCGDPHGQLGLSAELLQQKAQELRSAFVGAGGACRDEGPVERQFPGNGSCKNFSEEGLRFSKVLAQMMMSELCADVLEAGRPESVQLLRTYVTMNHVHVSLRDWLGDYRSP